MSSGVPGPVKCTGSMERPLSFLIIGVIITLFFAIPWLLPYAVRWSRLPFHIRMDGPGFLSPFFFRASNLRLEWDSPETDRVLLRCRRVRFRISVLSLLRFRLRISRLVFDDLYLEYENRVDSFRKTHLLPRPGRLVVDTLNVHDGEVYLIDHTLPGPYRLRLRQIHIEDSCMDLSSSALLLFNIRRGRAALGRGIVLAHRSGDAGTLLLKNVDWNAVVGWEDAPYLPGASFSVFIKHHSLPNDRIEIQGSLHLLDIGEHQESDRGIPFAFEMHASEYRLTLDLGIQRFVEQMLHHARPGLLETGVLFVGKEIFERLKKTDDAKP